MAYKIQIQSSHILETTRSGASKPRVLKKGSPEWKEAVASFLALQDQNLPEDGIPETPKPKPRTNSFLREADCQICDTHFSYPSPMGSPTLRVFCSDKCSRIAEERRRERDRVRYQEKKKQLEPEQELPPPPPEKPPVPTENRCVHCGHDKGEEIYPEGTFLQGFCSLKCCQDHCQEKSICLCCRETYTARSEVHRFCSKSCKGLWYKWERNNPILPVQDHCETCGKSFEKHVHNQRFCSKQCWRVHRRDVDTSSEKDMGICEGCQKEFVQFPKHKKYCTKDCYFKTRYKKHNPYAYAPPEKITCDHCKEQFENDCKGGHPRRFCSADCRAAFHSNRKTKVRKERNTNLVCALAGCENTFNKDRTSANSRKYCSEECLGEARKRSQRRSRGLPEVIEEEPIPCEECFVPFLPPPNQRLRARFCSQECQFRDRKREQLRSTKESWQNLVCKHCERTFSAMPTIHPRKPPVYCSPRCEEEYQEVDKIQKNAKARAKYQEKVKKLRKGF